MNVDQIIGSAECTAQVEDMRHLFCDLKRLQAERGMLRGLEKLNVGIGGGEDAPKPKWAPLGLAGGILACWGLALVRYGSTISLSAAPGESFCERLKSVPNGE
jgi:hypothetical protein